MNKEVLKKKITKDQAIQKEELPENKVVMARSSSIGKLQRSKIHKPNSLLKKRNNSEVECLSEGLLSLNELQPIEKCKIISYYNLGIGNIRKKSKNRSKNSKHKSSKGKHTIENNVKDAECSQKSSKLSKISVMTQKKLINKRFSKGVLVSQLFYS